MAACTLPVASFASGHTACISGKKTLHQARVGCASASKSKTKTRSRAGAQAHAALAPGVITVDCESTQTLLQGGAAQCSPTAAAKGSSKPVNAPANSGAACFAALAGSKAARQLSSRVPFLTDSTASPQVLANQAVPGKRDKEQLRSVVAGYGMCLDMAASWRSASYAPAVVSTLNDFWIGVQAVLLELASGNRTFGDAARLIAEQDKAYKIRIGILSGEQPSVADTQAQSPVQ